MSRAFVLLILFFLFCCSSLYVSGGLSGTPIAEYSETLAKYLVLVSSAVYQGPSSSNQCISSFPAIRSLSITHRFTAQYRGIELFGFAGVDSSKQRIIFSYRGTYQFQQLLQELTTFIPRPVSTRLPDVKINTYFRNAQQALWSQTKQAIIELQKKYPQYQILFTGHSLGAAIAAVNAFDIYQQGLFKTSNVVLYTFGQPRTGNIAFARYMDKYIPTVYRLVHNRDIVAHLPPCFTKLLTRGCATDNKQYAYHHGTEIWYKEDMPSVFSASAFDAVDFDSLTEDQLDSVILDEEIPQTEEMELDDSEEEFYDSEAEIDSAFDFDAAGFTSRRNTYIVRRDADSANNENFDSPTEQLAQKAAKKQINIREAEINSGINLDLLDIKSADGQNEFEPIDPNFNDQKMLRGHTISAERPQDNDLLLKLQPARSQVALQTSHNALDHSGLLNTREAMAEINSIEEAEFDAAVDSASEIRRCSNESLNCSDGLLFKISVSDHQYYFQIEVKRHCNGLKQ